MQSVRGTSVAALCAWAVACSGAKGDTGATGAQGQNGNDGASGTSPDGGIVTVPSHAPAGVSFSDIDPTFDRVEGVAVVTKATDESDVTSYAVYYGKSATEKLYATPIVELFADGTNPSYELTTDPLPIGATHLLVFAKNAAGENGAGVSVPFHDGRPAFADISAGQAVNNAYSLDIALDRTNGKVLVVASGPANMYKPALYRCNMDGTSCVFSDISAGSPAESALVLSIDIDAASEKLLVASEDYPNPGGLSLFRCNLDGTGCTYSDISVGAMGPGGAFPSLKVDAANAKLLVATVDATNSSKPSLVRCNLDGTACTRTDISSGAGTQSGTSPSLAIDAANGKALVVTADYSNASKPTLFRCNLDGTACTRTDISSGAGGLSGLSPSIAVDAANGKLLVATENGSNDNKPALFRCALDGTSCKVIDISVGAGPNSGLTPSLAIDPLDGKILVVTADGSNQFRPSLFRCNVDGSGCFSFDISAGQGTDSGDLPRIVVDPVTGRFFVGASDAANGARTALFFLQ